MLGPETSAVFEELYASSMVVLANAKPLERPDRIPRALLAGLPWRANALGAIAAGCARYPKAPAVVDDDGEVTYRELWHGSETLRGRRNSSMWWPRSASTLVLHDRDCATTGAACEIASCLEDGGAGTPGPRRGSVRPSAHRGRMVILTSGMPGRPKGASQAGSRSGPAIPRS
jgi:hypothetical protein